MHYSPEKHAYPVTVSNYRHTRARSLDRFRSITRPTRKKVFSTSPRAHSRLSLYAPRRLMLLPMYFTYVCAHVRTYVFCLSFLQCHFSLSYFSKLFAPMKKTKWRLEEIVSCRFCFSLFFRFSLLNGERVRVERIASVTRHRMANGYTFVIANCRGVSHFFSFFRWSSDSSRESLSLSGLVSFPLPPRFRFSFSRRDSRNDGCNFGKLRRLRSWVWKADSGELKEFWEFVDCEAVDFENRSQKNFGSQTLASDLNKWFNYLVCV